MSVDPLAAGVANLTALVDAELAALAADAQALQGLLAVGTVVQARVLPSNGLTDLLDIAGMRVAASLPPTVRPGDVLTVQVTGFQHDQIMVQVLTAEQPAPIPETPLAPSPAVFVAASIQTPVAAPSPVTPSPAAPPAATPSTATPPPASASPSQPASSASGPTIPVAGGVAVPVTVAPRVAALGAYAAFSRPADLTRPAVPAPAAGSAPHAVQAGPTSIEARLAAARAAATPPTTVTAAETARGGAARVIPQQQYVVPPRIAAKGTVPPSPTTTAAAPAPRAAGLSAYTQPVALLRALRLPVTPSNVASASLALERPERLPQTLATLERALPQGSADPQVATLRTLLGFIGRIEPDSPVLATQIAAYVDQVVAGAEPKLATLLAAARASTPSPVAPAQVADSNVARAAAPGAPPHAPSPAPVPTLPAAVAAERGTALTVDLKQTLLSLAANPPTPEALAPPIASALTALTAVQVQAAQLLATQPDGIVFALPLATPGGTANAQIAIKREAPNARGTPLNGENFRIAFVLETAHYGTVAIDLVTVGREVTVDVRAETPAAMRAFRDALGTLTARLETLHYRVASAGAGLGAIPVVAIEAPPVAPRDPNAIVDRTG
jgi:hypothetical protein